MRCVNSFRDPVSNCVNRTLLVHAKEHSPYSGPAHQRLERRGFPTALNLPRDRQVEKRDLREIARADFETEVYRVGHATLIAVCFHTSAPDATRQRTIQPAAA